MPSLSLSSLERFTFAVGMSGEMKTISLMNQCSVHFNIVDVHWSLRPAGVNLEILKLLTSGTVKPCTGRMCGKSASLRLTINKNMQRHKAKRQGKIETMTKMESSRY